MSKPHCSLDYHGFGVLKLETTADKVRKGIYENDPPFTGPPLTAAQFNTLIENYHHTYDDYKNGGILKKPFFIAAKAALIKGMDDTATFVDNLPGLTEEIILMSGFTPTKVVDSAGQTPAQPSGAIITRGGIGEMFAEVPKVDGAEYYGCIVFAGQPMPAQMTLNGAGQLVVTADNTPDPLGGAPKTGIVAVFDMSKSRKKRFLGLQTGTMYYFYFYAGNATGVSILSEVRNAVCG